VFFGEQEREKEREKERKKGSHSNYSFLERGGAEDKIPWTKQ